LNDKPARILIVAGSDSSGGAGIQADIKTATALGCYAMTAITAVTAQNTTGVKSIHPIPPAIVREQIEASLDDIGADAIKIGMLHSAETVVAVAGALAQCARDMPIVLDPVLVSTSGTALLDDGALSVLKSRLVPLAIITPNIAEALQLLDKVPVENPDAFELADELLALGPRAAVVTGFETGPGWIGDIVKYSNEKFFLAESLRIDTRHTHGTGCSLATALACGLACGLPIEAALEQAHMFVHAAIETAPGFGAGHGPLNHMHALTPYRYKQNE
jgi:hydroxymethylpyrimidine/phosphomethylpyrimidine kinase